MTSGRSRDSHFGRTRRIRQEKTMLGILLAWGEFASSEVKVPCSITPLSGISLFWISLESRSPGGEFAPVRLPGDPVDSSPSGLQLFLKFFVPAVHVVNAVDIGIALGHQGG